MAPSGLAVMLGLLCLSVSVSADLYVAVYSCNVDTMCIYSNPTINQVISPSRKSSQYIPTQDPTITPTFANADTIAVGCSSSLSGTGGLCAPLKFYQFNPIVKMFLNLFPRFTNRLSPYIWMPAPPSYLALTSISVKIWKTLNDNSLVPLTLTNDNAAPVQIEGLNGTTVAVGGSPPNKPPIVVTATVNTTMMSILTPDDTSFLTMYISDRYNSITSSTAMVAEDINRYSCDQQNCYWTSYYTMTQYLDSCSCISGQVYKATYVANNDNSNGNNRQRRLLQEGSGGSVNKGMGAGCYFKCFNGKCFFFCT